MTHPKFPFPVRVATSKAIQLVRAANILAGDEWAPEFSKETTIFWFKDEQYALALAAAEFLDLKL